MYDGPFAKVTQGSRYRTVMVTRSHSSKYKSPAGKKAAIGKIGEALEGARRNHGGGGAHIGLSAMRIAVFEGAHLN